MRRRNLLKNVGAIAAGGSGIIVTASRPSEAKETKWKTFNIDVGASDGAIDSRVVITEYDSVFKVWVEATADVEDQYCKDEKVYIGVEAKRTSFNHGSYWADSASVGVFTKGSTRTQDDTDWLAKNYKDGTWFPTGDFRIYTEATVYLQDRCDYGQWGTSNDAHAKIHF